jgi:hypothetical protein
MRISLVQRTPPHHPRHLIMHSCSMRSNNLWRFSNTAPFQIRKDNNKSKKNMNGYQRQPLKKTWRKIARLFLCNYANSVMILFVRVSNVIWNCQLQFEILLYMWYFASNCQKFAKYFFHETHNVLFVCTYLYQISCSYWLIKQQ